MCTEANLGDDGLRLFGCFTPPSLDCVVPDSGAKQGILELVSPPVYLAM